MKYRIKTYNNLMSRLRNQALNVEETGHLNAARLMREAAALLDELVEKQIIVLEG